MNRNSQRILIFGGIAIAVIIIALLAIIAVALLSGGDDGESGTEAANITQTATRTPTPRPTPRPTRTATAPSSSHSPEPQQPTAVATTVQQEPPPGTPQQTAPPSGQQPASTPPPTAPPAGTAETCPGPPAVAFFTANPLSIITGQSSTLDWGAVTNATNVVIDQGIGPVGAPGGRVVSPGATTIYTLTATGCGGTIERQATVIVNPPPLSPTPPPPTPTPTEQPPPPGGGSWGMTPIDLAMTGLNPDNLPQGEVWVTLANNGPYGLANTEAKLACSGTAYYVTGGSIGISTTPWSIYVTLEPGWSNTFDTTISVDTTLFSSYFLQCSIEAVGYKDDHPENDSISAWIP